ncbi:MAG: hypothetical protein L0227_12395 [Chloroflexi bacterium]|nr:hypothetical protein [Chloroflexota bacterium]
MTDPAPLDAETAPDSGATDDTAAGRDLTSAGTVLAPTGRDATGRPWPPFAHGSETEMARILDFYGVHWEYEPRTFPILWNLEGDVVESFSPDFYLPDLDLFLELTTLKQRLVRKKNRKLRRLRELYPDIRIKLFYARDFRAMMLKYGRLALADSMSGTLGQVVPDRGRDMGLEPAGLDDGAEAMTNGTPADDPTPVHAGPDVPDAREAVRNAAAALEVPVARDDPPAAIVSRRNASRSRRRRAAAAARAAARASADIPARRSTGHRQEDAASR